MKNLIIISGFLLIAACGGAGSAKKEMRLSTNQSSSLNIYYDMLTNFTAMVSERTKGRYEIKIYPDSQLGDQVQNIELVKSGSLEFASVNAAGLENFVPLWGGFNLPYVINGDEHSKRIATSPELLAMMREACKPQGFVPIIILDGGSRNFFGKKPYLTPADMQGQKFRIQPSPLYSRIVQLLGGTPIPMNFSEIFSSIQQGVIDGSENVPTVMFNSRIGEVAKHYTFTETTRNIDVVIMSVKAWEALSPEDRTIIEAASKDATEYFFGLVTARNQEYIKRAEDELQVKFHRTDIAPFKAKVAPMINDWMALAPENKKLIDFFKSLEK